MRPLYARLWGRPLAVVSFCARLTALGKLRHPGTVADLGWALIVESAVPQVFRRRSADAIGLTTGRFQGSPPHRP